MSKAPRIDVKPTPAWWTAILNSRFVLRHPPLRWRLYGLGRWLQGYRYHPALGWDQTRTEGHPMTCVKHRYRDRVAAMLALAHIRSRDQKRAKTPRRAYPCPNCGGWHLTSRGKR